MGGDRRADPAAADLETAHLTTAQLKLWPPLPVDVHMRRPRSPLPFPLAVDSLQLYSRARYGLREGVRALRLGSGDEALMPGYHHGSEVQALLEAGVIPQFYDLGPDLTPDQDELEARLGPRTRALYLIHYFGFPQDAARWRSWCDQHGLLLLEDVAQGWLGRVDGRPLGSFGDAAIFCLYKTLGLPDGAVLVGPPATAAAGSSRMGLRGVALKHVEWLAERSGAAAGVERALLEHRDGCVDRHPDPENDFALLPLAPPPARMSVFLLPRLARMDVAVRRRANYQLLLAELGERVPSVFAELPPGACPLVFPIADRTPRLAERLGRAGIETGRFWQSLHPSVVAAELPGARAWREQLLALPVHQELRVQDLERIVRAVTANEKRPAHRALRRFGDLDAVREQWETLAPQAGNIFSTWEWASTWLEHFGDGQRLLLFTRDAQEPQDVIVPLCVRRRPLRIVRFLGHGPADQLGPICAPMRLVSAAGLLRSTLAEIPAEWDLFVADELPGGQPWERLLGGVTIDRIASPTLRLGAYDWEGYLSTLSSRLRQEIRHDWRKLAREHDLRFRLATATTLDRDLKLLFQLHEACWQGSSFAGRDQAFHCAFARVAQRRGWLRLWFLELDGRPAAAWYGFRFSGTEWFYQVGRDPAWRSASVGLVLLAHTIRDAIADGIAEYRFLRGAEAYKYRFASEDPGVETVAVARTAAGRAALAGWRSGRRARELAKNIREQMDV